MAVDDKKKALESTIELFRTELWYESKPRIDFEALRSQVEAKAGAVEIITTGEDMTTWAFRNYTTNYDDAKSVPAQIMFLVAEPTFDYDANAYEEEVNQSWHFPKIEECLPRCHYKLIITDFMARGLETPKRLELFNHVLPLFVENTGCLAIHLPQSRSFVAPEIYLDFKASDSSAYGFFNVRFYRIENSAGDMLVDTVGLGVFGLPDIQCHFKGLDVNELVRHVHNVAGYILNCGDVITDGDTIEGLQPDDKWCCQHEEALIPPQRVVIDINTGSRYTAGERWKM